MKKRLKKLILFSLLFLFFGCTKTEDLTIEKTFANFKYTEKLSNTFREGYKYYLPRGMKVESRNTFNEVITDKKFKYYLYVDMISYHYKKTSQISYNEGVYYYTNFQKEGLFGYLTINNLSDTYLIEIMYNYAKIEVIAPRESDINIAVLNSINILNSIKYNNLIIKNLLEDKTLDYGEEEYNIFKTKKVDSKYLNVDNTYIAEEETVIDQDLIKKEGN